MQNIAIYTFSALIFRLKPDSNMFRASLIVAGIWISIILNITINIGVNGASNFYVPTGYCEFPNFPSPNPESKSNLFYQRVLDIGCISCPKDSC
jgi:hypothetical protein